MLIGHMCWSNLSKEISKWGGAFLIIIIITVVFTIVVMIMIVGVDANLIFLQILELDCIKSMMIMCILENLKWKLSNILGEKSTQLPQRKIS